MRERLVAAFVGLTILVVALYGIPRAYFLADLVRSQEQARVERTSELVAAAVEQQIASSGTVTPEYLDALADEDEWIVVRGPGERTVSSTRTADSNANDISSRTSARGASVEVTRSGDAVGNDIAQALLPLVLIGLGLVVVAGFVGVLLARRLARPFRELADAARGLGSGRLEPDLPSYRVPEAQAIGTALGASGARISELIDHERQLASNASHELRTPVTALRLDLEDLASWPETPESVATELHRSVAELDRLNNAITSLLEQARENLTGSEIDLDLDALVADTAARLDGEHRVTHVPTAPLPTRLDPEPVIAALELLVTEAREQGVPATTLTTAAPNSHHEIRLVSERGYDDTTASGARWTRAGALIASLGGQLTRPADRSALIRLPKRPLAGS